MCFGCAPVETVDRSVDGFSRLSIGRVMILLLEQYALPALGSTYDVMAGRWQGYEEIGCQGRFEDPLTI